jgi:hypothetical protein
MKNAIGITLAAALAVLVGGCFLTTGQKTIFKKVNTGATSNLKVNKIEVHLDTEDDYAEHKDKIKSIDGISVVAVIKNNRDEPTRMKLYISNDTSLVDVGTIESDATPVFLSPTVPASDSLRIGWAEGFQYIKNKDALINEILGDGVFTLYAIADEPTFSLRVKAEIGITFTVGY